VHRSRYGLRPYFLGVLGFNLNAPQGVIGHLGPPHQVINRMTLSGACSFGCEGIDFLRPRTRTIALQEP